MTFLTTVEAPTLSSLENSMCGKGTEGYTDCLPERDVPTLKASLGQGARRGGGLYTLAASPYLDHIVVEMLGVAVNQVDFLGVRVVHLLLVYLFCHGLVVGFVDVALFPDGNSVEMSLCRADVQEGEGGRGDGKKISKTKTKTSDQKSAWWRGNLEFQNRTNGLGSGGSAHSKLLGAASFLRGSRRGHHTPRYQAGSSGLPSPPPGVRANPAASA